MSRKKSTRKSSNSNASRRRSSAVIALNVQTPRDAVKVARLKEPVTKSALRGPRKEGRNMKRKFSAQAGGLIEGRDVSATREAKVRTGKKLSDAVLTPKRMREIADFLGLSLYCELTPFDLNPIIDELRAAADAISSERHKRKFHAALAREMSA